jgi:hypothetical protein
LELGTFEYGRAMPASETLGNRDILSPPLKEIMATTVTNPNNTNEAKYHFMINGILCP